MKEKREIVEADDPSAAGTQGGTLPAGSPLERCRPPPRALSRTALMRARSVPALMPPPFALLSVPARGLQLKRQPRRSARQVVLGVPMVSSTRTPS
jgi:hypothetical protein